MSKILKLDNFKYTIKGVPKQPVLMLHGLFGFKEYGRFLYYHNIIDPLASVGAKVVATRAHPTDSIANRAKDIHKQLEATLKQYNTDKVHIIAHSMGGLDARYLIDKLDYKQSVLSLTTLSTPHRGSYIADWTALNILERFQIEKLLKSVGIPFTAIENLSPQFLEEVFNPDVKNAPHVQYESFGATKLFTSQLSYLYYFGKLLEQTEGPNDGLVSLKSAEWGSQFKVLNECDHLNLINWSRGYDVMPVYTNILNNLAKLENQSHPLSEASTASYEDRTVYSISSK